jgi:hypothetical protein
MPLDATTPGENAEVGRRVIAGQMRALRQTPELQEVYRWELLEPTPMTAILADDREAQGMRLLRLFQARLARGDPDVAAISAILVAGCTYLVLRAKTAGTYNGIDIRSDHGWERIEQGMETILAAVLGTPHERQVRRKPFRPARPRRA